MATSVPVVNGDMSLESPCPAHDSTLQETLQQMHVLIKENQDLKEALKQTNSSMKERFEGLSVWKEQQKEEKSCLEAKLDEARQKVAALTKHNEELMARLQGEPDKPGSEWDMLKAQIARLQAEKSDLVAMNSELQLKMLQGSPEDSFIEIRIADGEVNVAKDSPVSCADASAPLSPKFDMTLSRHESEELTVSQLLQSLKKENLRAERLEQELQAERERQRAETPVTRQAESQTVLLMQEILERAACEAAGGPAHGEKSSSEVESLKAQMKAVFSELQQAQSNLDAAEKMKRNLQNRCWEMEKDRATLQAQLEEKQQVQAENERLKLQLDSMQSVSKLEQRKAEEERKNLTQLKDAYTKLFEDYKEMKEERKNKQVVSNEEMSELEGKLCAAEQALAMKQQQIDEMKQEMCKKEQELETVLVFQAQAEVYSSDFYAERAAREKIHEEKERLAAQLEYMKKQNNQLQEDLDSLGRQSLNEMQRRHVSRGAHPKGAASPHRGAESRDWKQQVNIPEHACPKCGEVLPDLDSLQIHIMDCII